jgi:hypothetical protein
MAIVARAEAGGSSGVAEEGLEEELGGEPCSAVSKHGRTTDGRKWLMLVIHSRGGVPLVDESNI